MDDSSEVRPNLTSKEKTEMLLRAAISKKAYDPAIIRLDEVTPLTDYFLIVSARSTRHATAVAEEIQAVAKENKIERLSMEGVQEGNWALLDFGDVVAHVFKQATREFYDLESLWADAPRETVPEDLAKEMEAHATEEEDDEWNEEWDEY
jgi:ribosome-associated protein